MTKRWTVIRASGQADVFNGPKGVNSPMYSYLRILSHYYQEAQSGGSNYDRANILLADGKVVVENKLSDIAYSYGVALREAREEVQRRVDAEHNKEF